MVATPLTAAQVQALYSTAATGQRDAKTWAKQKGKGARRVVVGTRTATTR